MGMNSINDLFNKSTDKVSQDGVFTDKGDGVKSSFPIPYVELLQINNAYKDVEIYADMQGDFDYGLVRIPLQQDFEYPDSTWIGETDPNKLPWIDVGYEVNTETSYPTPPASQFTGADPGVWDWAEGTTGWSFNMACTRLPDDPIERRNVEIVMVPPKTVGSVNGSLYFRLLPENFNGNDYGNYDEYSFSEFVLPYNNAVMTTCFPNVDNVLVKSCKMVCHEWTAATTDQPGKMVVTVEMDDASGNALGCFIVFYYTWDKNTGEFNITSIHDGKLCWTPASVQNWQEWTLNVDGTSNVEGQQHTTVVCLGDADGQMKYWDVSSYNGSVTGPSVKTMFTPDVPSGITFAQPGGTGSPGATMLGLFYYQFILAYWTGDDTNGYKMRFFNKNQAADTHLNILGYQLQDAAGYFVYPDFDWRTNVDPAEAQRGIDGQWQSTDHPMDVPDWTDVRMWSCALDRANSNPAKLVFAIPTGSDYHYFIANIADADAYKNMTEANIAGIFTYHGEKEFTSDYYCQTSSKFYAMDGSAQDTHGGDFNIEVWPKDPPAYYGQAKYNLESGTIDFYNAPVPGSEIIIKNFKPTTEASVSGSVIAKDSALAADFVSDNGYSATIGSQVTNSNLNICNRAVSKIKIKSATCTLKAGAGSDVVIQIIGQTDAFAGQTVLLATQVVPAGTLGSLTYTAGADCPVMENADPSTQKAMLLVHVSGSTDGSFNTTVGGSWTELS